VFPRSRTARLLAGLFIVLLVAIPLALSTPWAQALVFERATAWARGRFGIDIRAAAFGYRLTSLSVRLGDVTVADLATPDRPFLRIGELDLDLAASALGGRLDFDAIRVRQATLTLDRTTRAARGAGASAAPAATRAAPLPFEIGVLQIEALDLALALGDEDKTRVAVRQISSSLRGSGPGRLEGELRVTGGIDVSFATDAVRVAFDRAEGHIVVEEGSRAVGSVTAFSPVGNVRAEGTVPLNASDSLDLRYEGTADLEQSRRWWSGAPDWTGGAAVRGEVRGPLRSPEASFAVRSADLTWAPLRPATLDAAGRVSSGGLHVDALSLVSPQARVEGSGRLAFDEPDESSLSARWSDVGTDALAGLLALSIEPVSRTALSGSAALAWTGPRPTTTTIDGRLEAATAAASPDETAIGSLRADGRHGRWNIAYRQSLAGSTRATIEGRVVVNDQALPDSTVAGSVALQSSDARAALVQLQRLGLPLPSATGIVGSEQLAFDGTLEGSLRAPRVNGNLSAEGVRIGDVKGLRVQGALGFDARALDVSTLTVESPGNRVAVQGSLPWRDASGGGAFEAHIGDPAQLVPMIPGHWQPAGTLDVTGQWTGSAQNLRATARLLGADVTINGLAFESIAGDLDLVDRILQVTQLQATQPGGALSASASWDLSSQTLVADTTGRGLALSVLAPDEAGGLDTRARLSNLSIDAHIEGSPTRPDGTASMDIGAAEVDGRHLGSLTARVDATGGVARVTAGVPERGANLDARLTLDDPWPFVGHLAFTGSDLAGLGQLAGLSDGVVKDVSASLDATLDVSGTARDPWGATATLALTGLDGQVNGQALTLSRAGRLLLTDGRVRVAEPMRLALGSATLELASAPAAAPGVAVTVDGGIADLAALVPGLMPEGVTAEGEVKAEVLLGERLNALEPTGHMSLSLSALRRGEQELARATTLAVEADATAIHVRELRGTLLGGPFEGGGVAPAAWIRAGREGSGPAAEPATFWMKSSVAVGSVVKALRDQGPDIAGTLNVTVEGTATAPRLDAVRATLREDAGEIAIGAFKLSGRRPTEVRLEDGRLHVDGFEWRGPESTVTATGSVGLADGIDGRLHLDGAASLALLNLLVPERVDGRATFDVEVSGTAGTRQVLGTVAIEDGSLAVQRWRLAMADWSGTVVLDRNSIAVKELRGQFNGGEASIEGSVPIGSDVSAAQSLAVTVRGAFLGLPKGLRSQLDATLEWSHARDGARLSGNATVTAREYREPVTELARLASALMDSSGGSPVTLPAALAATELDVRLATIGPLAMTNSVARVEMLPELQLTGTIGRPALSGQIVAVDDGRIQVGGRQYRLRDSRVEFSPERGLVPRLDITGNTRVGDYTVYLHLTGPANEIETSLMSDPPLGERDLQTLLVTGQQESLARGGDADQMAVGAVSGGVLGVTGQFIGFDSVVVGTTDDLALVSSDVDPALRLTVSKRLGNRFELVLSDNLDDNELTWVIIYRPRPGFEVRAISRGGSEYTGEFRQEIPFGPGVSPPRTTARRQVKLDRIASVTVSGEPGFPASDVLSATKLGSGDDFDFGRWLEDRDRIARFYLEHGYFAARIVPTRRVADGATGSTHVTLDYRITRGPRTVLSVSGYRPPPAVLDQLRHAWSDSVLVDLLEADLTEVMRAHLIDVGYLRSTVAVDVDESVPDQVTATMRVEPGALTVERRLAFSGNTVISEQELLAVAQADAMDVAAWRDPAPLLEVLESAYAARGYLATEAIVGAIEFSDGSATLPIHVVEGPVARVTTLTVNGPERVSEAEAAAGTGLAIGATYIAGGERSARLALERYYRNLGYRDVAVESMANVNAGEGLVDVVITVHEGPRYVVQSVRTTGVESTRGYIVDEASRIEPGAAASPAIAEAARRRLYDIGTFRSAEVTFEPIETPPGAATVPVDAVVSLQESRRFMFLYGIEVTNQYESLFQERMSSGGVAADLRDRNFLGRGWTLGAGLRYEPDFRSARIIASVPRIRSRRIRTNVYVDSRTEDRDKNESAILRDTERAFTVEQRWRVRAPVELSWGYRYNYRDISLISPGTGEFIAGFSGPLAALAGAVVLDRRDNMFDATRGWLVSTSAEWGLQALGSDLDYLRTLVRGSYYQPVGPLTWASNIRWGNLEDLGGEVKPTVLDLFYQAGGTQTVRGYKQDSLSAYTIPQLNVPVGGSKLLVLNQEVRFPVYWLFSGVVFADAGNTFRDTERISLDGLAVSVGLGVRIRTPLAPVRIDLGFPVSGRTGNTSATSARWHFSIGHIF
jgi:outer membrane protein assembly factor BamA/autotransporter translocation and assembly factor TamB